MMMLLARICLERLALGVGELRDMAHEGHDVADLLVLVVHAEGRHAGHAYAVLDDPEQRGVGFLLGFSQLSSNLFAVLLPALLLIGVGVGVMLTPSVNVVQSAFPEEQQGEISGLSRSVSNLGSSLGTAIAGTILVSDLASGNRSYALALLALAVVGLVGLAAALRLPGGPPRQSA